jgi:hypothetical protein
MPKFAVSKKPYFNHTIVKNLKHYVNLTINIILEKTLSYENNRNQKEINQRN